MATDTLTPRRNCPIYTVATNERQDGSVPYYRGENQTSTLANGECARPALRLALSWAALYMMSSHHPCAELLAMTRPRHTNVRGLFRGDCSPGPLIWVKAELYGPLS